ncbi:MAG: hypothetical protein P8Y99_05535 [Calditrichaceae bacterium]
MRSLFVFLIVSFLFEFVSAQIADSIQVDASLDSIKTVNTVLSDSMRADSIKRAQQKAINAEYDQSWKKFQLKGSPDKTEKKEIYYQFDDLITINYTGLADIFRHKPEFQMYNFMWPGFPRFIGYNNLLPHQTDIYLNGFVLNDPMHGMFNTHMISLDGLREVDDDIGISMYGYGKGINLKTKSMSSLDEPYSRVMFRQGDDRYTDLDIDFSRKLSENISVNLGGINKIYFGGQNYAFQYRAGLFYRITNKIFSHTTINIDREKLTIYNESAYPEYYYFEFRHDYNNSIYYITNPDSSEYWRLDAGYTRIRRRNESDFDSVTTFYNRRRVDQIKFGIDRIQNLGKFKLHAAFSAYQNKFWGSSFASKLTDNGMNAQIQVYYPMLKWLGIKTKIGSGYLYNQDISWSPAIHLNMNFDDIWFNISGNRAQRFPYRNERSIYFQKYRGNDNLDLETLQSYSAEAGYVPFSNLSVGAKISTNIISNEILMDSTSFYNGPDRSFNSIELNSKYSLYWFTLELAGNINDANINLSPKKSFSGQLKYRDTWLKGAVIIDAVGSFHWYDSHNNLYYNPIVERIYWDNNKTESYYYFSYKIAATVKSAQLYMAMDNPMSNDYSYITGYPETIRRVRFGVNWVLMD